MKILLVRHGESTANVAGLLSSLPSDDAMLTERGRSQVADVAKRMRGNVDTVYVSPLRRTVETADILFRNRVKKPNNNIDARIREIDYGIYSGRPNNSKLDAVRRAQVDGDYLMRFSSKGENKLEILTRLYDFLIEVIEKNTSPANVVVVSHGSIIGWLERIILALDSTENKHRHVANAEVRSYTLRKRDSKKIFRHRLVDEYCAKAADSSITSRYRTEYIKLANLYNDTELELYAFEQLLKGMFESDIVPVEKHINYRSLGEYEVIAVCALHNSEIIVGEYIDHYVDRGIKHFVFIDNNSDDRSVSIIKSKMTADIYIDIWQTKDVFDGFKAMGWKQRMFFHYGIDRWYLNLDVDELAVFVGCEKQGMRSLVHYAAARRLRSVGGVLVDMYSEGPIVSDESLDESIVSRYRFFDMNSYTHEQDCRFVARIFGGPRTRLFDRHPSLQKFPLAFVDSKTIAINPHFWFPYEVNQRSERLIGLLHYKFLPGDLNRYKKYVKSGVHWDDSSQYRSYVKRMLGAHDASFYDDIYSAEYVKSESLRRLVDGNGEALISEMPNTVSGLVNNNQRSVRS